MRELRQIAAGLRRVTVGLAASHACAAARSHGAALSLSKKRSGTRLVKYLAKYRRFLMGSLGNGLLRRLIAANNNSYMLRTATVALGKIAMANVWHEQITDVIYSCLPYLISLKPDMLRFPS